MEFNDSLETYYVSNVEEGVRGTFIIQGSQNRSQCNRFNCILPLREGRVTKLTYSPDSGNRPIASEGGIIRLCQDDIHQQVSQNKMGLGEIFGMSIRTGQNIEFEESVNIFDISDNQKRVGGDATLLEGPKQRQVSYKCTVNIRQGTITNATMQ